MYLITYLAISFRERNPFLPLPASSTLVVTRSILDMIFIHEISRLTIADIADRTPLRRPLLVKVYMNMHVKSVPEELVLVFHELRFY